MKSLRTVPSDRHAPGSHSLFLDFVEGVPRSTGLIGGVGRGGEEGEILLAISQRGMLCVSLLEKRCLERFSLIQYKTRY